MKLLCLTKLFALFGLSALAVHAAGPNFDQVLKRLDSNQDGAISFAEVGERGGFLKRADADGDQKITRAEYESRALAQGKQLGATKRFAAAATFRDLEYAEVDGQSLRLDLYLPKKQEGACPLIVWIHGGGWKNGDKGHMNPAMLQLTEKGYAIASINYRLEDITIHPNQIHDCKGAVRWLKAHASDYGYDPQRVGVGGSSAGGHLALLLGLSSGVDALEGTVGGNREQSSAVSAIVDFYGPSELSILAETSERFNRAHPNSTNVLESATPLNYLSAEDPPLLILHGDQDRTVPLAQSELLHERYEAIGLPVEFYTLPGAGHGGPTFSTEEQHLRIKRFLDRYLMPKPH